MSILEDVILGCRAGTELTGEKLVCVQVQPDAANTKILSKAVELTTFGTVTSNEHGVSHHIEITLQIKMNEGIGHYKQVPYIDIWVEYKRIVLSVDISEKITVAGEKENWAHSVKILPRLVREMHSDFWAEENKQSVLEAHIPRILELPDHELELMRVLNAMPVEWYLQGQMMARVLGRYQRPVSVTEVSNKDSITKSKHSRDAEKDQDSGQDQKRRCKLGQLG